MRLLFILPLVLLVFQSADAAGTFSASEAQGQGCGGEGRSIASIEADILTDDSIDAWLKKQKADFPTLLAKAKKGNINPKWQGPVWNQKLKRYTFHNVAERNAMVKQLERGVDESITLAPLWPFTIKEGQIGSLTDDIRETPNTRIASGIKFSVIQIVDKQTAMIDATREMRFFLIGDVVKTMREGQTMRTIPGAYRVEGKKTYKTAFGGASTIHVLRSYDLKARLDKIN